MRQRNLGGKALFSLIDCIPGNGVLVVGGGNAEWGIGVESQGKFRLENVEIRKEGRAGIVDLLVP